MPNERDFENLRTLELFAGLSSEHFESIKKRAFFQYFPPQTRLVGEGQEPVALFVIIQGSVKLVASGYDKQTIIEVARPPRTINLPSILSNRKSMISANTLERSLILMIPAHMTQELFEQDSGFARAAARELAILARLIMAELKNQKLQTSLQRMANWILQEVAIHGHHNFIIPFDKVTFAARIGTTRENLSRNIAKLQTHGVEIRGRKVMITDITNLMAFAGISQPPPPLESQIPPRLESQTLPLLKSGS